ncbi:PF06074 family protein [Bordetella bronchiseptica 00-P-2730]|nr:PF06074 family protein [Bordetella bronchiseptica 00-P-2730]
MATKKGKNVRLAPSPELNREIATIADGMDITRGYVGPLLVNTDSVLRVRSQSNLTLYESVYSDPQVKSVFAQRQLAVTQCNWRIEPASEAAVDKRAADALSAELNRVGWDRVTSLMLFGVFYGYAVSELIYARMDGLVGIEKIKVRNRRRFRFDPEGGLRMLTPNDMLEGVPAEGPYFWHFATGADNDDEPYGQGLGHWLYWPVFFKRQGIRFWLTFLDKFGQPSRVGKYDAQSATPADKSRLLQAAAAMGTDSAVIIPEGMTLELLEAARSGAADYKSLHDTMDNTMAKVVLGQTASSQGTPGRLGNDQLQGDVRRDLIKADADLVCESFNLGPARWLTAWNFPDAQPPRVFREVEEPEDLKTRAERDEIVARTTGFRPTLSYVQQTYGGMWEKSPAPVPTVGAPTPVAFAAPVAGRRAGPTLAPLVAAQARLDRAVQSLPGDQVDADMDPVLAPVVAAIRAGASSEEAAELLLKAIPEMDDAALHERLARAIFVADLWGQISDQDAGNA